MKKNLELKIMLKLVSTSVLLPILGLQIKFNTIFILYDKLREDLGNYIHKKRHLMKPISERNHCHECDKTSTCHIERLTITNNIKRKLLTQLFQKYNLLYTKTAKKIVSSNKIKVMFQKFVNIVL